MRRFFVREDGTTYEEVEALDPSTTVADIIEQGERDRPALRLTARRSAVRDGPGVDRAATVGSMGKLYLHINRVDCPAASGASPSHRATKRGRGDSAVDDTSDDSELHRGRTGKGPKPSEERVIHFADFGVPNWKPLTTNSSGTMGEVLDRIVRMTPDLQHRNLRLQQLYRFDTTTSSIVGDALTDTMTVADALPLPGDAFVVIKQMDPLAIVRAVVPRHCRRSEDHPQLVTTRPFLTGTTIAEACASPELARELLRNIEDVRGDTLRAVATGLAGRVPEPGCQHTANRHDNPLTAVQSAPGGGKSALLDTITLMCKHGLWTEHHCPNDTMREILNMSDCIAVTYSRGWDVNLTACDSDVETGLSLRILHSYFVDPSSMSFRGFFEPVQGCQKISVHDAIGACIAASRNHCVVLLVDEMMKLLSQLPTGGQRDNFIALLCSLMAKFPVEQFSLVCTTLDATCFGPLDKGWSRPIRWAPLPAFSPATAEAMMSLALTDRGLTLTERILISDAAGHPRSLQLMLEAILEARRAAMKRGDTAQTPSSLKALRDAVLDQLGRPVPCLAEVRLALLGEGVALGSKPIPGDDRTLRELIAAGNFINTDVTEDDRTCVIPKLSMLRLLKFAQQVMDEASSPYAVRSAAECITALAGVESDGAASYMANEGLEDFMSRWLELMTIVHAKEPLSVLSLFHVNGLDSSEVHPVLSKSFSLDGVKLLNRSKVEFAKADVEVGRRFIQAYGNSNPCFNVLLVVGNTRTARMAIAIETRMGRADNDILDYRFADKLKAWPNHRKAMAKKLDCEEENMVYVYAAARHVLGTGDMQTEAAKHGILLMANQIVEVPADKVTLVGPPLTASDGVGHGSRARLQDAFTPTLADRALLTLKTSSAEASSLWDGLRADKRDVRDVDDDEDDAASRRIVLNSSAGRGRRGSRDVAADYGADDALEDGDDDDGDDDVAYGRVVGAARRGGGAAAARGPSQEGPRSSRRSAGQSRSP